MERLTMKIAGVAAMASEYEERYTIEEWVDRLQERLAAYEDTELTPEEVRVLKDFCQRHTIADIDHLNDLAQAEQDGRLVVLDEPRKPLVWGDEAQDTILCPRCLSDLMGGFEFQPDSDTKMYQCPHCGQPVDATKAITLEESEEE